MGKFEDGCYGSVKGIALIGKVLAGQCRMHYTRVAVGKGIIPEDMTPKMMDVPADYVMDAMISAVTNPVDGECQVSVQINSAHVETGFYATGLLLYAEDPDEGEIPYTYLVLENEPEWIRPSSSIVGKLATFDIIAAVGDVDTVTAAIDPEALLTLEAAKKLIAEHSRDPEAHMDIRHMLAQLDLVIPPTGWEEGNEPDEPEGWHVDIPQEQIREDMVPILTILPAYMDTAADCGMSSVVRTLDGALRVYAEIVPEDEIHASLALLCTSGGGGGTGGTGAGYVLPPATGDKLGGVKVGPGLNVASDGTLSVNAASEAEVNELLTGTFAPDDK